MIAAYWSLPLAQQFQIGAGLILLAGIVLWALTVLGPIAIEQMRGWFTDDVRVTVLDEIHDPRVLEALARFQLDILRNVEPVDPVIAERVRSDLRRIVDPKPLRVVPNTVIERPLRCEVQ